MSRYAQGTSVDSAGSRAEIERTVTRYGATGFSYGWDQDRAAVAFQIGERRVRLVVSMPDRADFQRTPSTRQIRSKESQTAAWEQACRQRWRALALIVKAKLEAIEAGISTFDAEFLAAILLPGGGTVGDRIIPAIDVAYEGGALPSLLPGGDARRLPAPVVEVVEP